MKAVTDRLPSPRRVQATLSRMTDSAHILVVEDEPAIRSGLCDALTAYGHRCDASARGDDGLERALTGQYDLILLDVMLPGLDGFTVCRRLRDRLAGQGILLLTARGSEADVLEGFRAGADDYVCKPFSIAQLLARVDAVLRRARRAPAQAFVIAGLAVDPATLRASRGQAHADLNRRDVDLLALFAGAGGRVIDRIELLTAVWGYPRAEAVESRCVDMHLVKLRRKLGEAFGHDGEHLIETVRGEGYRVQA